MFYVYFIIFILVIPAAVNILFYKYIRKYLFLVPILAFLLSTLLLANDIMKIASADEIQDKISLYFHNDWCMGFYLFYLPAVIVSLIINLTMYGVMLYKNKKDKRQ